MVKEIHDESKEKWDQFVLSNPTSQLYHVYPWRHVLEKSFGLKTFYFISEQNGTIQGVLPLAYQKSRIFGSYLISLTFFNYAGVLAVNPTAQEELIQTAVEKARELKVDYLELRHMQKDVALLPARQHKVTFLLDLPPSPDMLWKQLKDKVRNQVRKAEKEGLTFKEFASSGVDEFYPLFALNMRNLGSPVISKEFFKNILKIFPDKVRIFMVYFKDRPVAAGYTLTHRAKMEIPWAVSNWKYLKYNPNVFLYWNILRRACQLGLSQFDFGRCTRASGTYHFKQQWGGTEIPLFWYYSIHRATVPNAEIHPSSAQLLASKIWRWLPLKVATTFGPCISRHLPV